MVILAGTGVGGVAYIKRPKDSALDFKTAPITKGEVTQSVTANGQLMPVLDVQVGSQVSGIITNILVDFNSKVKEGDILAQIDPSTYEFTLNQSKADLLNAQAALELAQVNAKRAEELYKSSLISKSDYDTTMAALHQAEATVTTRQASVERSKVDLQRCTIYSPVNGIVIDRAVTVGQTVAASFNTPKLFEIANDLSKMQIDAMVSEADVGGVEEGQRVTFTVDAFPARQFSGSVRQVRYAPTTNQNVVTYTAVVGVNNEDLKLRPGMTANASIITAQRRGALKIPNAALRFRPPDSAILKPPSETGSTNRATNEVASASPSGGPPPPPWVAEGRRPSREEMQKYFESLTPEQRQAARQQFRGRGGGPGGDGPPGGFGGGGVRASGESPIRQEGPVMRTVYVLAKGNSPSSKEVPMAKPVTVKVGITDGSYSEVMEGLKESDEVITGVNTPAAVTASVQTPQSSSPFGRGGFRGR